MLVKFYDNARLSYPPQNQFFWYIENEKTTRLKNYKRKYLKKWKKKGHISDKQNANALNIQIRKAMYKERKQQIRRKIKPGNSKTLWDSVKIATDKEIPYIRPYAICCTPLFHVI